MSIIQSYKFKFRGHLIC